MRKNGDRRTGKTAAILIAAVFLLVMQFLPLPEAAQQEGAMLTAHGRTAIGVLLFCLVLWITEALPFFVTGFCGLILLVLFQVESLSALIRAGFGSDTVVFFIGSMIISASVTRVGLGKRICMAVLNKTGNRSAMVLFSFLLVGQFLGTWITTLAAAAIMTPMALSIIEEEKLEKGSSSFGKALMIAAAWGPLCGGTVAPTGGGSNPIAISFLRHNCATEFSFVHWMLYGIPCGVVLLLCSFVVLMLFFKPESPVLRRSREELRSAYSALPPMSRDERNIGIVFAITIMLWLTSSLLEKLLHIDVSTALPALIGACALFFPGVSHLRWSDIESSISWSSVLLIGSGIAIGTVFSSSGAAHWISAQLLSGFGDIPTFVRVLLIILIVAGLKIGMSSNTVTATVIMPIMLAFAQQNNISVLGAALPAMMSMSLGFILVTSTPTNIIPYSTGWFSVADMARAGTVVTLAGAVLLSAIINLVGMATGIYLPI